VFLFKRGKAGWQKRNKIQLLPWRGKIKRGRNTPKRPKVSFKEEKNK
jgi:hypothetical protein